MKLFDFSDLKLSIGKLRRIDWRHYVCSGITVLFLLLAVFRFEYAYLRIGEAMLDVYNSVRYCISGMFGLKLKTEITVLKFSSQPFRMPFNLPNSWEEFKILWGVYWKKFFSLKSVGIYFEGIGNFLFNSLNVFTLIVPLSILFFVVLKREPIVSVSARTAFPISLMKKRFAALSVLMTCRSLKQKKRALMSLLQKTVISSMI